MRWFRVRAVVAVGVSLLVLSCTDGQSPSDLHIGSTATLTLALASGSANLTLGDPLPINRIRITVLRVPDNSVVAVHEENVDPTAEFWELAVMIPLPAAGILRVRLRIELINVTFVGGQEVETVEFSALTEGIDLIAGQTPEPTTVTVERGPVDNLAVTALAIQQAGPVIEGDVVQLEASVTTNDPNANPTLFWTSLDEALATVDDEGLVQALLPGEVEIVVTAGAQSASLLLGILQRVAGITLSPSNLVLEHVGEEGSFTATVVDPRGDPIETPVEWSVGNATVIEDLGEGSVRALAPGSTNVTATVVSDPMFTASAIVLVELIPTNVQVTPEVAAATALGQQVQFSAVVTDLQGAVITGALVSWRSNAESVATVDASGKATAVGVGEAGIFADVETGRSASAGSDGQTVVIISGSAMLVVTQVVTSVEVTPTTLILDAVGASGKLFATSLDAGGTSVSGATFEWASSNSGVVVVNATGAVTATGVGTATITATSEGVSGSSTVEVIVSQPENHAFTTAGNTQLRGGSFPLPPTPTVNVPGLLANTPGLTVTTLGPFATSGGGSVTIEPDGDFLYTPLLGSNTTDSFEYTVANGAIGIVTIDVLDMVWYLDNQALGSGTGTSEDPFGSLLDFAVSNDPAAGHTIFIHTGDGTDLNYDTGITLFDNQSLIGEGVGLTVAGVGTIVPAGVAPRITNTAGHGVQLADGNTVSGLTIQDPSSAGISIQGARVAGGTIDQVNISGTGGHGISLGSTGAPFTFNSVDIQGAGGRGVVMLSALGMITFNDLTISGGTSNAFEVNSGAPTVVVNVGAGGISNTAATGSVLFVGGVFSPGSVTFNGGSLTDTNAQGITLFNNSAAVTVNTPVTINDPSFFGVEVLNAAGPVTFADVNVTTSGPGPSAGLEPAASKAQAELGDPPAGVFVSNSSATVTFGRLTIATTSMRTLNVRNSSLVRVTDPSSTLTGSSTVGMAAFSSGLDMTFASVTSTSASSRGIDLSTVTGNLTINGGSISNAAGIGVSISAGSPNLTYNGSLTYSGGRSVQIQNATGGTATFGGLITDSGTGIDLLNNTGATINFNGGLDLDTGANTAFSATGGGTVNVTGTNTLSTTTGTGISIQNTTIGGSGVTFESVSVNGAVSGIVLDNTGSGSFTVTGTGDVGSGGTIRNATSSGVTLNQVSNVSLSDMMVIDPTVDGIVGTSVNGFTLSNSTIECFVDTFVGLRLTEVTGTMLIDGSTIQNFGTENLLITNTTGTLDLTLRNSTFAGGLDGAVLSMTGTASATALVSGSTFSGNLINGMDVQASNTAVVDVQVTGANSFTSNDDGIFLGNNSGGTLTFDVMGNGFTGNSISAVNLQGSGPGLMSGSITGNTISGGPLLSRGIDMFFRDDTDAIVRTSGNNVSGGSHGVMVQLGFITDDLSTLDLTIETEDMVLDPLSATPGIDVTAFEETTLCTNIRLNTITVGGANFIELRQNDLSTVSVERLLGSTSDEATVELFLETENPASPDAALVTIATLIEGVLTGTCRTP